jgi:hypothetical protein
MIIGDKTCFSCAYRVIDGKNIYCRRYPPTVILVPSYTADGHPAMGLQSSYPIVNPNWPCGEYHRNPIFRREELEIHMAQADGETKQ